MAVLDRSTVEGARVRLMERYAPEDVGFDMRPLSEAEKHRLLMRLEARFLAWAGESITVFKLRTGGDHADT